MKLNKSIYAISLAATMGLWSCSTDEIMPGSDMPGKQVPLTITVSRDDVRTRTELSENAQGGLNDKWLAGDELFVINSKGNEAGTLVLESGEGTSTATFSGTLYAGDDEGSGKYTIWYPGYPEASVAYEYASLDEKDGQTVMKVNLASQDFRSPADLSAADIMYKTVDIIVADGKAGVAESVTMTPVLAMARFSLEGLGGKAGNLRINDAAVAQNSIVRKAEYLAAGAQLVGKISSTQGIGIDVAAGQTDVYAAFIPGDYTLDFTFTTAEGEEYTFAFENSTTLEAGKYYCSLGADNTVSGIVIPMGPSDDPDTPEEPGNPGNMGNWGLSDETIAPKGVPFSPVFASRLDGWVLNTTNSYYDYGGFCRAIEYTNGLNKGLLTSQGGTCIYFQWGRYLGFPSNTATGSTRILNAASVDIYVGYLDGAGVPVKYTAAYMGNSAPYNVQRSADWAIVFGQTNNDYLDYIYRNTDNANWYARSADPCPTGYRLPTYDELKVFIPSTEEVNGSYAEIKEINGTRYAFKWVVGSSNNVSYIDVTSVKTSLSSVTVNSSEFNSAEAQTKRIYAYGYLMNNGKLSARGTTAAYWSSDSGNNNALDDVTGKGGRALYIEFSGTTAVFAELNIPFGFGLPVMPIKDASATESSIKPWLPYSYDLTRLPGYTN